MFRIFFYMYNLCVLSLNCTAINNHILLLTTNTKKKHVHKHCILICKLDCFYQQERHIDINCIKNTLIIDFR